MLRIYFKIYFFRDSVDSEDGGRFHSRKLTNESIENSPITAGANLENLRNVFIQKRPVNYGKPSFVHLCNTLGYDISSIQGKYMNRTFSCDNTEKTKVN